MSLTSQQYRQAVYQGYKAARARNVHRYLRLHPSVKETAWGPAAVTQKELHRFVQLIQTGHR